MSWWKSFFKGFRSVLDLFGDDDYKPNDALTALEIDRAALESDWQAVSDDFRKVIDEWPLERLERESYPVDNIEDLLE